jgi:hypothetical protein
MRAEVKQTTRRDEHGRLDAVTVNWAERLPGLEGFMLSCCAFGLVGGLFLLVFSPGWGLVLLICSPVCFATAVYHPGRTRSMTLNADGHIITPFGYAHRDNDLRIEGDSRYITSIESRRMPRQPQENSNDFHEVIMTSEGGALIRVSVNLDEAVAFQVAVLLSKGLRELRRDEAERLSRSAPGGGAALDWGNARAVLG